MVTVKLWYWDTCSILILVSIQWLKIIQNDYTIFFWKKVLKNLIIYPKNVNQITWNSLKIQNTLSQKKEAATRLSEFLIPTGIFPVSDAGFLDCLGLSLFMTYFSSCLEIQYKMFMKKKVISTLHPTLSYGDVQPSWWRPTFQKLAGKLHHVREHYPEIKPAAVMGRWSHVNVLNHPTTETPLRYTVNTTNIYIYLPVISDVQFLTLQTVL